MDGTQREDGIDGAARRPLRPATPAHAERLAAWGVALLVNALAVALLMQVPGPLPATAGVEDAAIEVVWITPPTARPRTTTVPAVRETAFEPEPGIQPGPAAADARAPDLQPLFLSRGGQIPLDEEPAPLAPPAGELGRPPGAETETRTHADYARPGVFNPKPADPFARQGDGPFRMQDRSLGGRLQRMARRADCAELRAQLRGGGDRDAVVRAMVERGCT